MSESIKFQVETTRVLEILSSEIYDSPLALLRENVQNSYDAILMRCARDSVPLSTGSIDIVHSGTSLSIEDNGIGMTEEVLRNNFWKAGSSGKKTDLASRAGVIGTFGIGAMANFGIATKMEVTTRSIDSNVTLLSIAERDSLSIAEDCISLEKLADSRPQGTKLVVSLEPTAAISDAQAIQYLSQYVMYVPVAVSYNGQILSKNVLDTSVPFSADNLTDMGTKQVNEGILNFTIHFGVTPQRQVRAEVTNVEYDNAHVAGSLLLSQGAGPLMGYRNYFGLAPSPISSSYQLGGIANLSNLVPTAGREALSRESVSMLQQLVALAEKSISESISQSEFADSNPNFQQYIVNNNRYDLAGYVRVQVFPENEQVRLQDVLDHCEGRNLLYYTGRDSSLISTFSSPGNVLLHISQNNPLRQIQAHYIQQVLKLSQIPDQATVTQEYSSRELTYPEAALAIRIASTLNDDYFLNDVDVRFVEISHGVQFLVEGNQNNSVLRINRSSPALQPILECYQTAPSVFSDFVKDFVRNSIFQHVRNIVPSSAQGGVDALKQVLQANRELYSYEETDRGDLEPILSDYLSGRTSLGQAIRSSRGHGQAHAQHVTSQQVGNVETAIPDIVSSPSQPDKESELLPKPAIIRNETECKFKILSTEVSYPQLNSFKLFLGLSNRLFKRERLFFETPHTTRIIWGRHRVIYIFDHPNGHFTLYYDLELRTPLADHLAGGKSLPSTTLLLKNRLFVPIPEELEAEFRVSEGAEKRYYVNFDTIP